MLRFRANASARVRPLRGSRLAWFCGLVSVAVVGLGLAGVAPAQATPAKPLTDWSFYMQSTSTSTAYTLGCNQGSFDADHSDANSEVFLDFGGQITSPVVGTEYINGTDVSDATIESLSEQFAYGYYICTGTDTTSNLNLAIGTNNSLDVGTSEGETWAGVVNTVSTWVADNAGQVSVWGGSDIEPGFGSASAAIDWSNGFADKTSALYLNYGSADGCPPYGSCNNGWDQYDVWYVSWGSTPATIAPQIYCSAQGSQWADLSLYGADDQSGAIFFQGPLDQYDLDMTDNYTSTGAWDDLVNDLDANSATAQTPPYSLEIHDEVTTSVSTGDC
jgi:hypothetical protein